MSKLSPEPGIIPRSGSAAYRGDEELVSGEELGKMTCDAGTVIMTENGGIRIFCTLPREHGVRKHYDDAFSYEWENS